MGKSSNVLNSETTLGCLASDSVPLTTIGYFGIYLRVLVGDEEVASVVDCVELRLLMRPRNLFNSLRVARG